MRNKIIGAGIVSLLAAPMLAIVLPGTASAEPTPGFDGGRERVKVTVTSTITGPIDCAVHVDAAPRGSFPVLGGGRNSTVISGVAPGTRFVRVVCSEGMVIKLDSTRPVQVALANPALDALDSILVGAGSSSLATDRTLR